MPNKPAEPSLRPCPFCGSLPQFGDDGKDGEFIECSKCQCTTPLSYSLKDDCKVHLRMIWNRRVDPAVAPRETQTELQTRIKQLRYVAERAISQGKDEVQIDAMELLQFVARLEGVR